MLQSTRMILSISTPNFAEMATFYQDLLGHPINQEPNRWVTFAIGDAQLVVWRKEQIEYSGKGAVQLCFEVEDLDGACTSLSAHARPSEVKQASHGRELFFEDPDGNRLILYEPAKMDRVPVQKDR